MIFIDSNVFMYAVGRQHPLRDQARGLLRNHVDRGSPLASSAEVLQEMMHAYLPVDRIDTLDAALTLATDLTTVWPLHDEDVLAARRLHDRHRGLSARDLLHLAVCVRHDVDDLATFDRGLFAAWSGR